MSVTIVTFANLGKKKNLKTPDILPVIQAFFDSGKLQKIICGIHKDFFVTETVSAIPAFFWYPLRFCEKFLGVTVSRDSLEALFDYCASVRLPVTDMVILHGGHFLPRTLLKAKKQGSLVIDIAVSAHLAENALLEREEASLLGGMDEYEGTYARLLKKGSHQNEVDYVIALSEFVRHSYIKSGFPADRIFVASPDIDGARFFPSNTSPKVFKAVYVGYTTLIKGLHYLLSAWNTLSLPDAKLILIGGDSEMPESLKKEYENIIQSTPTITYAGSTQYPEKVYQDASVLVFPSLSEGFGRVTLEAMACGVPVITTENARGIVEDGKTGFVVPIRDSQAIAEKLQYLYDHRDVAEQMGREARTAVEHKKSFGEAVYEIYEEIVRQESEKNTCESIQINERLV